MNFRKNQSDFERYLPKFYKLYILSTLFAASFIALNQVRLQIPSETLQLLTLIPMVGVLNLQLMKGMQFNQIKDNMIQLHDSEDMSDEVHKIARQGDRMIYTLLPFFFTLIINLIIIWSFTSELNGMLQLSTNILIFLILSIELFKGMQSKAQVTLFLKTIKGVIKNDKSNNTYSRKEEENE